jgi:hypothetical protein
VGPRKPLPSGNFFGELGSWESGIEEGGGSGIDLARAGENHKLKIVIEFASRRAPSEKHTPLV